MKTYKVSPVPNLSTLYYMFAQFGQAEPWIHSLTVTPKPMVFQQMVFHQKPDCCQSGEGDSPRRMPLCCCYVGQGKTHVLLIPSD